MPFHIFYFPNKFVDAKQVKIQCLKRRDIIEEADEISEASCDEKQTF